MDVAAAGLQTIDAAAFVHPKWNPKLADGEEVLARLLEDETFPHATTTLTAIVPNARGMERAIATGVKNVSVWLTGTESFSQRNLNMSIEQHVDTNREIGKLAKAAGIPLRGYISNAVECPFEGAVDVGRVRALAQELQGIGCYEISLADTLGSGSPVQVSSMVQQVNKDWDIDQIGLHLHNTYGLAMANITMAMAEHGVSLIETSVGGLGGCPYAPGATGNVATEDVLFLCKKLGIETGVDLDAIMETAQWVTDTLGGAERGVQSSVGKVSRDVLNTHL